LGRFHPTAVEQIKQVGVWMKTAGGGIYATRSRAGDLWREGDSIRYTRSKDERTVYCYALDWPGNSLRLTTVKPAAGSRITMFGYPEPVQWKYDSATGLTINLPESMADPSRRPTQYAWGWSMQVTI
jgi:alpha-L-fucosidase